MKLFLVELHGTGLGLRVDNRQIAAGFFKNEYVWASSGGDAAKIAIGRVCAAVSAQPGVVLQVEDGLEISVESVRPTLAVWRSVIGQGYVFYPMEEFGGRNTD